MPLNQHGKYPFEGRCGPFESVELGRENEQEGWYKWVAAQFLRQNDTVLDVGCGLGGGLRIMRSSCSKVWGIERDGRLSGPDIVVSGVNLMESSSFTVVTAIDVIEHVVDDISFLNELIRIAQRMVVIVTPNWLRSTCRNRFHYREYTPTDFIEMVQISYNGHHAEFYLGNSRGDCPRKFVTANEVSEVDAKIASVIEVDKWAKLR